MKIAIPATANNIDSEVCPSFGRTEFFLIYNTNDQSNFFLDRIFIILEFSPYLRVFTTIPVMLITSILFTFLIV